MAQLIDTVRQHTGETGTSQQGQAPCPSKEAELLLGLGSRGGSGGSVSVSATGSGALEGLLLEEAIGAQGPGNTRERRDAHGRRSDHAGAHSESTASHYRRLCVCARGHERGTGWKGCGRIKIEKRGEGRGERWGAESVRKRSETIRNGSAKWPKTVSIRSSKKILWRKKHKRGKEKEKIDRGLVSCFGRIGVSARSVNFFWPLWQMHNW